MIEIWQTQLGHFRGAFSRETTFFWFGIIIIGFVAVSDTLGGVSPLVRGLNLATPAYYSMLNFFQSSAVNLQRLQMLMLSWIWKNFEKVIVQINGHPLYCLDAKKIAKEGRKMPTNKWQHQDSSSNAKPEYFMGQSFEVVGVLVSLGGPIFCLPFFVAIIDGFRRHNRDKSTLKERAGTMLKNIADNFPLGNEPIFVADAWYAAGKIINKLLESGAILISRVAKNAVANYPAIAVPGKRGRPAKYGKKVDLRSLFTVMETKTAEMLNTAGETIEITYWSIQLMWKPLGHLVQFVGSESYKGKIILLSTNLELSPVEIIQAYFYRPSIETTFWYSTQQLFVWYFRFWSKLDLTNKDMRGNFNLHRCTENEKFKFWQKVKAYELYVLLGFFSFNFLLYLSHTHKGQIDAKILSWFRTVRRDSLISLVVVKEWVKIEYISFTQAGKFNSTWEIFLEKQLRKNKKSILEQLIDKNAA